MKAGIICFTEHGVLLAEQLVNGLAAHGILCEAWLKKKEYRSALPVEVAFLEPCQNGRRSSSLPKTF